MVQNPTQKHIIEKGNPTPTQSSDRNTGAKFLTDNEKKKKAMRYMKSQNTETANRQNTETKTNTEYQKN